MTKAILYGPFNTGGAVGVAGSAEAEVVANNSVGEIREIFVKYNGAAPASTELLIELVLAGMDNAQILKIVGNTGGRFAPVEELVDVDNVAIGQYAHISIPNHQKIRIALSKTDPDVSVDVCLSMRG